MSPIPIREALSQLYYEGLVHSIPCVGSVVAELDIDKAIETTAMRYSLEQLCFKDAIKHIDDKEIKVLSGLVDELKKLYNHNDIKGYMRKNREFYLKLYNYSNYNHIKEEMDNLYMSNRINSSVINPKHIPNIITNHEELISLIKEHKYEEAAKLHIAVKISTTILVLEHMEEYVLDPKSLKKSPVASFFAGRNLGKERDLIISQIRRNKELLKNVNDNN